MLATATAVTQRWAAIEGTLPPFPFESMEAP
jgi:hypothetical protein